MQVYNDFVIISRDVSIDANDNMLSIVKIIDRFNFELEAEQFKQFNDAIKRGEVGAFPMNYVVTSSWSLDTPLKKPLNIEVSMRVLDSNGKQLGEIKHEASFAVGTDRLRINAQTDSILVNGSGRYQLEVVLVNKADSKELASNKTNFVVDIKERGTK